ncbi:hypothetical protein GCM10027059_45760 [Myceligenerans halotolerans]
MKEAVADLREASHHLVLATGRSLAGALLAAVQLGIREGYIVASNGAVVAEIGDGRCKVLDKRPAPAEKALRHLANAILAGRFQAAAEIVGHGYKVTSRFPDNALSGAQVPSNLEGLWAEPTPRIALRGEGAAELMVELRSLGLTAHAVGPNWVDITAAGLSKATSLEKIRSTLGVHPARTAALGDGANDREMIQWAHVGIAMGDAPEHVRQIADETTGTVWGDGAAHALHRAASWMTDSARCHWWTDRTARHRCDRPAVDKIGTYWRCAIHIDGHTQPDAGTEQIS